MTRLVLKLNWKSKASRTQKLPVLTLLRQYVCAIKHWGKRLLDKPVTVLNLVKNNLVFPYEWKTFICVPLIKKGDPTKMSNYRGMILMAITAKLYNRLYKIASKTYWKNST